MATGAGATRIWAPPGVALAGADDEPVGYWTYLSLEPGQSLRVQPHEVEPRPLGRVLAQIPADFAGWALQCTADQVRLLGLYVAGGDADDPFVVRARVTREELSEQLARHSNGPQPRGVSCHLDAAGPDGVYDAFTDREFECLVKDVISEHLAWPTQVWHEREDTGIDALFAEFAGVRHVFQVDHHAPWRRTNLADKARLQALALTRAWRADVHWFVTSRSLTGEMRRQVYGMIGPWAAERQRVVDATQLDRMLGGCHELLSRSVKLRAARAHSAGSMLAPRLRSLAETKPVREARQQLERDGIVAIVGAAGTGKSSLLEVLLADCKLEGFTPTPLDRIDDLSSLGAIKHPVACYWDDVADPRRLVEAVKAVRRHSAAKLIVTTTPEISASVDASVVAADDYDLRDRAHVFYNHVWAASHLHPEARCALAEPNGYRAVVDHPAFTPRLAGEVARQGPSALDHLHDRSPACADEQVDVLFRRLRLRAFG